MTVYTLTTLASFSGSNGSFPSGLVADSAGNLYGATFGGGPSSFGTVFEIVRSTGALLTLADLNGASGAAGPVGGLIADSAGNLYGLGTGGFFVPQSGGGDGGYAVPGDLFEIVRSTGDIDILGTPDSRFYAGFPADQLIADSAGNLFGVTGAARPLATADPGTTSDHPAGGTVFEFEKASGQVRTLYSFPFDGSSGFNPLAGLTFGSDGDLYGTTSDGGAANDGTVFKIARATGVLQTLATFTGSNGDFPAGRLVFDSAGNLYGTTAQGGASGLGTVFEINKNTGALITLVSFNGVNGAGPDSVLTFDSAGNLYGTTSGGGAAGQGTVFEIVGGVLQTIFTFDGLNGSAPSGGLILDGAGFLYGATLFGGPSGSGTVFQLSPATNAAPTLSGAMSNQAAAAGVGINPFSTVTVADPDAGQTETVTVTYAAANGTLAGGTFVQTAPGVYTVAASSAAAAQADLRALTFTPVAGQSATTAFTFSVSDGQATANSGASVVAIASSAYTQTTLATFSGSNGGGPTASLIADSAGNLYGVTQTGGASNQGTVFEIVKSTGALQTLATFSGTNGSYPSGGLTFDAAGNIYGTTSFGGSSGQGNVFEIVKSTGALLTLASFSGSNGARPDAGLIADAAGNFYGTTELGGASNLGTVFEIVKSAGAVVTLASFSGPDGSRPLAGLVSDSAGNLYGTTAYGGASSLGTVFEIVKTTGALQTLATFNGANGGNPNAGLIVDSAGDLFGTTYGGGASGVGTVFEVLKSTGAVQTLATFTGSNGARPRAGLVADAAGDLFGTTDSGPTGTGVVFEIVKSTGALQTVLTFTGSNGSHPFAGLIVDGAGTLYGVTSTGGASDQGTAFALSPPASSTAGSVIGGLNGGQAASDATPIQPFALLTIDDSGATGETITVTLSNPANGSLSGGGFVGGSGSYSASFASAAAAQAGLRALVFTPTANQATPGWTVSTGFTVVVDNGTTTATNAATTVVATSVDDAPTLVGIATAQTATAGMAFRPFASATVSDVDVGQTETVTVRYLASAGDFAGPGFTNSPRGASGTFASAAAAQAALRAATFTPTAGADTIDTLTVAVLDAPGGGMAATASTTLTVSTLAAVNTPPTVSRTVSNQPDTAGMGINPFSTVTVDDPDAGQTETVTVTYAAANGTLAGGGFVQTTPGVYTIAAPSAAAAQADLRALTFTPISGKSSTTAFSLTVDDGFARASDNATSVTATYTAAPPVGGASGGSDSAPSAQAGLLIELQNLERALTDGVDARAPGSPIYAQIEAAKGIAAQLDGGQITQAQAQAQLLHLVDGATAVAVSTYAFFTGYTPTAAGLNYLVHSSNNVADLNDAYYAHFSMENRYLNFSVNLATGVGAAAFQANYGTLSLAEATAKVYLAVFGAVADAAKVSALLDTLVPDGLGGQETRATYLAQYGGDGPNGQGTKAAMIGFLLSHAVQDGAGPYGAATEHYLDALAHGIAPSMGSELALTYGSSVSLVGVTPVADPAVMS